MMILLVSEVLYILFLLGLKVSNKNVLHIADVLLKILNISVKF